MGKICSITKKHLTVYGLNGRNISFVLPANVSIKANNIVNAYNEGFTAFMVGKDISANPYFSNQENMTGYSMLSLMAKAWHNGYQLSQVENSQAASIC